MIQLQVTHEDGTIERVSYKQFEVVRICPYLDHEFTTCDPDQIYCTKSHKSMAYEIRRACRPTLPSIKSTRK